MVDYNELKKKFKAKPTPDAKRRATKAAVKAIAREYELKKAELDLGKPPVLRRGPMFYAIIILVLVIIGSFVLSETGKMRWGKERIERKPKQALTSMRALAVALGRYKFHTGEYPSSKEGLAALAAKSWIKPGWDGPYINHVVNDPWGNAYVYETRPEGGHPILYSKGPNGRAGDDDDVLPDQEMFEEAFRDTSWTNHWAPYRLRGVVVAPDEETKKRVQEDMKRYD